MGEAPASSDGRSDFDFLHGDWNVHNRRLAERLQGSDSWQEFPSYATVRPVLHGLGNVDTISAEDVPGLGPFEGMTVRLFDPVQRRWGIHWASTASPGHMDPPLFGSFSGGCGTFYGEDTFAGSPIQVRFEWRPTGADFAVWEQAFSADRGRSWEVNWVMDFRRAAPQ